MSKSLLADGLTIGLVRRPCYGEPRCKDDVRRDIRVHDDAVWQACDEFRLRFGFKPTAEMRQFAYSGAIGAWNSLVGSRLRWSTQQDIFRRLARGTPLTRRQQFFLDEARQWQSHATWISQRALVLSNGTRANWDRQVLEHLPL